MLENIVVMAIPAFFFLIALEWGVAAWQRRGLYRLRDTLSSLSCGGFQQIVDAVVGLGPYMAVYLALQWLTPLRLSEKSWSTRVIALVLADFCYYWCHRLSHRVNFLWAGHIVHHQSEEYNLSTALRQSWFATTAEAIFYLPLALVGVPFQVYFTTAGILLLYQFWLHTRLIGKLGPIEWIFNTPSHHRAHHGVNPEYLDKNYGAILIVWDRIFGTFVPENESVIYGTVKPIATWDPVAHTFDYWRELWRRSRAEKTFRAKVKQFVAPPEWSPENPCPVMRLEDYRPAGYSKFEDPFSRDTLIYVVCAFPVLLVVASLFLNFQEDLPFYARALLGVALVGGLSFVGRFRASRPL